MNCVNEILLHTSGFSPIVLTGDVNNYQYSTVQKIQSNTKFEPNVLYYGMESQVQTTLQYLSNTVLVLIRDIDHFYIPDDSNNCIIEYPKETSFDQLELAVIGTVPSTGNMLLNDSFQLFHSVLYKSNLSEILNDAAQLIHNPLIVIDISYNIIAYSTCFDVNDEQWRKNIERGYCSFEYIAGFNEIEGVRNAPDSDEPFKIHCNTSPLRRCLSKLYFNGKHLGYLIAIEALYSFESMNLQLYRLISRSVAKELETANRINRSNAQSIFDGILIDLLEKKIISPEHLRARLAQTNTTIFSSYQVMVFNIMSYTNYDYNSEFLRSHIMSMFPFSRIAIYKGDVIVVVDTSMTREPIREILERNKSVLSDFSIHIGISDEGHSFYDILKYYNQCLSALHISAKLDPKQCYAFYNQYKFYIAMLDNDITSHPEDYYSKEFLLLLKYDSENSTQYVETLKSYICHHYKPDGVAEDLFIHRNTASYRINRIKDIFDFDIKDSEFTFNYLYSYKLYRMIQLGLF